MENFVADAIFIDATPERVLSALLDPEEVLVWMDAEEARVSAVGGGEFTVDRSDGSRVTGTISRIDRDRRLEIAEYFWERDVERRGPMSLVFELEPRDYGVWLTVRQEGLDSGKNWEGFAQSTRRELVQHTVTLKRHIEGI